MRTTIVNLTITGPLDQVAKILMGERPKSAVIKAAKKNGAGRPHKKRKYTKKNAEYWAQTKQA